MLECNNLTKTYKKKCVVDNLSSDVNKGEIFAFLGSNGAGKTTTIKMILGLVGIDSGEVKIAENVHIGYSPETPYFPPFLTGYEVLEYYAGIQKIAKAERKIEIPKLLETVGFENDKTRLQMHSAEKILIYTLYLQDCLRFICSPRLFLCLKEKRLDYEESNNVCSCWNYACCGSNYNRHLRSFGRKH